MKFAQQLKQGQVLIGTFIKMPHPCIVEVLATTGLDYLILDAEHAPFGANKLSQCILAARANQIPVLVRVPDDRPAGILRVLDLGADGIIIPHILSAAQIEQVIQASQYGDGGRGYSAGTRAGKYGTVRMKDHLQNAKDALVIAQIEDPAAVDKLDEILAVPGISACFIGRVDLAVAYGAATLGDPVVSEAVDSIIQKCQQQNIPVATFLPDYKPVQQWVEKGCALIAISSEHKAIQDYFIAVNNSASVSA